jgi:branched-chain amino acid transport system permease protein/urea transport system permease protein
MDPLVVAQSLNVAFAVTTLVMVVLGLAVVFGWLGVMNLAHGEFVMLGAFVAVFVEQQGWPYLVAIPLTILFCGVIGWVIEWVLIRPLYARPFDLVLATWGLSILLREIVEAIYGGGFHSLRVPVRGSVDILGASYPAYRLLIIVGTIILVGLMLIWYFKSGAAARVKAMVGNPELADAVGIQTSVLARNTFIFGTCLAGFAGVVIAPLTPVNPFMGLDFVINAFFVIIVGGLGSVLGLFTGAAIIGGLDSLVSAVLNRTSAFFLVLLVAIFFLWLRPRGIFSRT